MSASRDAVRQPFGSLDSSPVGSRLKDMKRLSIPCRVGLLAALGSFVFAFVAAAGEPTAFALVKEGNRHVGEEVRDRVACIRSEKSVGALTPSLWSLYFLDSASAGKLTEVKFAAGSLVGVTHRSGVLGISGLSRKPRALPMERLKVDSDRALERALSEPVFKHVKLTNTELQLQYKEEAPVWKVTLWASKVRKPESTVKIGEILVNAIDGQVALIDIKLKRLD